MESSKFNNILSLLIDSKSIASENRARKRPYETKSVHPADVEGEVEKGWVLTRPGVKKSQLKRTKSHDAWLEDRSWCLLHNMGYKYLSPSRFEIEYVRDDKSVAKKQIDAFGCDEETAIVIECKSRKDRGRRSLQKDIQETVSLQKYLRTSISSQFPTGIKPKVIWLYVTRNIIWSENDVARANDGNIYIVTENELQYFEAFLKHMGPAGKYQILGELLKNQKVHGIKSSKIPAIRGKIGGDKYYSFVTTPRQLLKIAFVNHQALNHPDGKPAYQRMVLSSRIRKIGKFIEDGGYFPTNILVNFVSKPRFDLISNKDNSDPNIKFGWLTLPNMYRSVWIIDGQHRLFGYSHLDEKFLDQSLFVIAFDQMDTRKEADLFITINHEQKSVSKSLLLSLLADIRMGDDDPSVALTAICSAIIRTLDKDKTSPFFGRFSKPGVPAELNQNLTISEVVNGMRRSGLVGKLVKRTVVSGPVSGATDELTIERARRIFNSYFESVREANPRRWENGKNSYISINAGIRSHLSVIAEIVSYVSHKKGIDFQLLQPADFAKEVISIAMPIFRYVETAPDNEISDVFSRKFGEGGVREYTYILLKLIHDSRPDFGSEEFSRWIAQKEDSKIEEANQFLMKLSEKLTDFAIDTLKNVHGTHTLSSGEPAFWEIGVESERIQANAFKAQRADRDRRKPREAYLNIVDLAEIAKQPNNWMHFEHVFKNPMEGERKGQKYYLGWINKFNELRNIAAHKNQLKTYSDEDLEFIEWLRTEVAPKVF